MCQSGLLATSVTQHTSGTASCYEQAAELLPLYMLTMNMLTMNMLTMNMLPTTMRPTTMLPYEDAAYNHAAYKDAACEHAAYEHAAKDNYVGLHQWLLPVEQYGAFWLAAFKLTFTAHSPGQR